LLSATKSARDIFRNSIEDLIARLKASHIPGEETEFICSSADVTHGKMRKSQGYTAAMVHDSRTLQVTLSGDVAGKS
jgi:hypothetical protein